MMGFGGKMIFWVAGIKVLAGIPVSCVRCVVSLLEDGSAGGGLFPEINRCARLSLRSF